MMQKVVKMIAGHLSSFNYFLESIDETQCALCGRKINEGIKKKSVVSSNFNDWSLFKFDSNHICKNCIACLSGSTLGKREGIRNYSIFITKNSFKKLERNEIQDAVFGDHTDPFIILITFSHKKHAFFYGEVNQPGSDRIAVGTDKGKMVLTKKPAKELLEICQSLYNAGFSRQEIASCHSLKFNRIEKYGTDAYYRALEKIMKYKGTQTLDFILHILKKEK